MMRMTPDLMPRSLFRTTRPSICSTLIEFFVPLGVFEAEIILAGLGLNGLAIELGRDDFHFCDVQAAIAAGLGRRRTALFHRGRLLGLHAGGLAIALLEGNGFLTRAGGAGIGDFAGLGFRVRAGDGADEGRQGDGSGKQQTFLCVHGRTSSRRSLDVRR